MTKAESATTESTTSKECKDGKSSGSVPWIDEEKCAEGKAYLAKDTHSHGLCNWNNMAEKQKGESGAEAAQILETSKDITDMGSILEDSKENVQAPAFI